MLQNQSHQGLILEDHQALGMTGFFSNPSSNNLAFLQTHHRDDDDHRHHHHHFASSYGLNEPLIKPFSSMITPSIPSDEADADDDDDDDTSHAHVHAHDHHAASSNNSTDLCQALLISCANQNPRNLHHHHQDLSSLMGAPPHLLSLQRSNPSNPWDWKSNGSECMVSKRSFNGEDNEGIEEDHENVNIGNNSIIINNKKNLLGISAFRMKKMKGRRKVREPRFCFKTLSDVDVLDDGYKWRKYGQKVVKNTQHPRSYYRCTQDKCRVKKRVERLAEDPRMVITTYEGRHVHSPSHDNPEDDSSKTLPILNNFFW